MTPLATLTLVYTLCMTSALRTPDVVVPCDGHTYAQATSNGLRATHDVDTRAGHPSMGVAQQLRHRALYDAALRSGFVQASSQAVLQGTPPYYELTFVRPAP